MNVASSYALLNKKTLLIGADLRKPRIFDDFGVNNSVGLSSLLIGKATIDEATQKTSNEYLDLITSGPIPPNPAELIESDQFNRFIQLAKENFDYVVIDNAPSFMVTDGIIVSKLADLNLFVLRINKSYKEHLKAINNIGDNGMSNKIGLVINDIRSDKYGVYNTYKAAYS